LVACGTAQPEEEAVPVIEKAAQPQPFDWPQWQGPRRDGVSNETGLLQSWPKEGPRLAWKAKGLGEGFSTPSVAAGRIYTMGNRGKTEYVLAFDEENGNSLWATATGPVRSTGGGYPGPRCTPAVDGELVYALGLNGDLVCLSALNGKVQWKHDLQKDFKGQPGGWGYCESPLIDGDKLICTPGGKTATLVALDKKTGKVIWTSQVPSGERAAYASAIVADVQGQRQYIQFLSKGVVGIAASDGKYQWRYDAPANGTANCSTAVFHDNAVFAASGYGTGGGLAQLKRDGGATEATEVYFSDHMKNHHGGMVLVDGYLYGANDPNQLVCLEFATGKQMWTHKAGKGSIAYADGRLYYRDERGPILMIEATPKGFVEKGRFEQPDRSKANAWPHPVIANGKLYIRDQDVLLCYDVRNVKE
jgi:outer membrane protein assembly factor BamB